MPSFRAVLVALSCLLCVLSATASPIPYIPAPVPYGSLVADSVTSIGFAGPDIVSTPRGPSVIGFALVSVPGLAAGNSASTPPNVIGLLPVPEPDGILVMFGAALLGVVGLRLRAWKTKIL